MAIDATNSHAHAADLDAALRLVPGAIADNAAPDDDEDAVVPRRQVEVEDHPGNLLLGIALVVFLIVVLAVAWYFSG